MGDILYRQGNYPDAFTSYMDANGCPLPKDARLWVDEDLHNGGYKLLDVMSMCCWRRKEYEQGEDLCLQLLAHPKLPEGARPRIKKNLAWHQSRLGGTP